MQQSAYGSSIPAKFTIPHEDIYARNPESMILGPDKRGIPIQVVFEALLQDRTGLTAD